MPQSSGPGQSSIWKHIIPLGTELAVKLYSLLHNAESFSDVMHFRLEHWSAPEHETNKIIKLVLL